MKNLKILIVGLLVVAAAGTCTKIKEATLERGIEVFLANNLDEALKIFDASAKISPDNPDAHAWHAECLRRMKRLDEAAAAAYRALSLDPQHAFAHTVLGDLFNAQYSTWERTDPESTWFHLREAVRYDPDDGNAWSTLWVQSMKRGEEDLEHEAAVRMIDSGFLSAPVLAYNRWQLTYLPQNAILLTNGDMDTYPSAALKEKEGLRDDVAVVNLSLLNLLWYAKLVAERYDIPLPFGPDELASLAPLRDDEGKIILINKQIVAAWMGLQQAGKLGRPLCAALTVSDYEFTPDARQRMVFCGPYYEIAAKPVEADSDMERIKKSLEGLNYADFGGSFTSPIDRSPVRVSMTNRIATNVTAAMLRYASLLADDESWDAACDALAQAKEFDSQILAKGQFAAEMDSLNDEIAKHAGP